MPGSIKLLLDNYLTLHGTLVGLFICIFWMTEVKHGKETYPAGTKTM